ncbi:serine/threonine-protein kinase [Micromonospora echinofusca]|uniref:non-specific serine/threonine protein kinase n=1 Tax=Micromonospora echinofusca TaxID=47858 RepID=A0ABS3VPR6_MICEH|nr:serine/threonine-protein kinase [Micromonospora echinofusca]MBO4206502.1 protein kinase [Micromonospora echinofusca]
MSNALPQLVAGRYRLISPLGQGGMGRVWKARDEVLHRDVAIKELVPPPGLTDDERREMRERSLREARAIARLNHVNVVRVFDVLRTDGDPWIVMEYVPSRSLQDTLAADGPVSPVRAAEIGLGVLGALKAAHKAGVMHRDIKPGNVLLGDDGRVVLTDFGLATVPGDPNVTRTGLVLGSPAYIAPERARDGTAGPEADLWSLGATLYAAVEGHSPFARPSAIGTLAALATEPLPPAKNAGPLKAVLHGLLRKDPAERIDADVAERLLRRVVGKRSRSAISLLDGVRRPGPNGPRQPRGPLVPAPRPAQDEPDAATPPPVAPVPAGDPGATLKASAEDAAPTARVSPEDAATARVSSDDAAPTALVPAPEDRSAPTARVEPQEPAVPVHPDPVRPDPGRPAPTATMPAQVGPDRDPVSGRATVLPPAPGGSAGRRKGLLIGVLVVLLLVVLAVALPTLLGGDGDDEPGPGPQAGRTSQATPGRSAAPQTSSAAPPTSAAPSSQPPSPTLAGQGDPVVPAGWRLHTDPTGFKVPVPEGWSVRREKFGSGPEDWRVRFSDGRGRSLLIDQTTTPKGNAVADWTAQEAARKGRYPNYRRVTIREIDYWDEAADWEWTQTSNGRTIHVRNRGFVTAPDKGYAIRWDTPADVWDENEAVFKIIADGFRPVRS